MNIIFLYANLIIVNSQDVFRTLINSAKLSLRRVRMSFISEIIVCFVKSIKQEQLFPLNGGVPINKQENTCGAGAATRKRRHARLRGNIYRNTIARYKHRRIHLYVYFNRHGYIWTIANQTFTSVSYQRDTINTFP